MAREWETFKLHIVDAEAGAIALQAWTGRYLSATADGGVSASFADAIGEWEKWRMEKGHEHTTVALRSVAWGKYLCCDDHWRPGEKVDADRSHAHEWEHWWITDSPNAFTNPGHTARMAISGSLVAAGSIATAGALAVPLLGFCTAGVATGSTAAATQSAVYGGATTGAFSILQSVGATMAWVQAAVAGAVATTAGVVTLPKGNATDRANSSDEQN